MCLARGLEVVYTRFMNTSADTIWLEINLGAIRRNVQRLQRISGKPVMAVVKANAYGHGLIEVSKAVLEEGPSAYA